MADQANPAISAHAAHAYMLVKALENVILSTVNIHMPGLAVNMRTAGEDDSILEPEAQQLMLALEKFINARLRLQTIQQGTDECEKAVEIPGAISTAPTSDRNLSSTQLLRNKFTSEQPPLLKIALEKLRHRVFNKMPIRLLAFNSDGSGMELIERSAVLDRIFISMESDFDKGNIQSELQHHLIVGTHQPENHVVEMFISRHAKYAILSHTWLQGVPGEVTYSAWKSGEFDKDSVGYRKLANFCRIAAADHGVTFGWMDTICINKDSSAELDESIRSMYSWYRDASICITYLAQTKALQHMHHDSWFTRGWTLQELLAPRTIKFYGANWQIIAPDLNDDERNRLIQVEIEAATTITQQDFILFRTRMSALTISKRMKWAANRQVTREEDVAYSLMGIFNVSLSIAYGEGSERAFIRLVKEILNLPGSSCLDILNWGCGPNGSGDLPRNTTSMLSSLIPSTPKQYLWHADTAVDWPSPSIPITLTHLRLHISVLLMPAISTNTTLSTPSFTPTGQFYANANVDLVGLRGKYPDAEIPKNYNVLDAAASGKEPSGWDRTNTRFHIIFGILNFRHADDYVELPRYLPLFSICLYRTRVTASVSTGLSKISTSKALTMQIKHVSIKDPLAVVQKSKLARHGMQLVTMYL